MQADTALVPEILNDTYPFNALKGEANVLIFPNLESGNIAYKILQRLGQAEVIGPILVGMRRPVHILQRDDEVKDIVNICASRTPRRAERHCVKFSLSQAEISWQSPFQGPCGHDHGQFSD
jgi:malate dehydrogenase (oxaloacetate-decarboxylating)(NADP+)